MLELGGENEGRSVVKIGMWEEIALYAISESGKKPSRVTINYYLDSLSFTLHPASCTYHLTHLYLLHPAPIAYLFSTLTCIQLPASSTMTQQCTPELYEEDQRRFIQDSRDNLTAALRRAKELSYLPAPQMVSYTIFFFF